MGLLSESSGMLSCPSRGPAWLRRRDVGLAFLLALASWVALTVLWTYASSGGFTDRIVGDLLSPAYRVGKHVAHLCFPNYGSRNTIGYYFAPLFGIAAEIVCLMGLWLFGISIRRWMYDRKPRGE